MKIVYKPGFISGKYGSGSRSDCQGTANSRNYGVDSRICGADSRNRDSHSRNGGANFRNPTFYSRNRRFNSRNRVQPAKITVQSAKKAFQPAEKLGCLAKSAVQPAKRTTLPAKTTPVFCKRNLTLGVNPHMTSPTPCRRVAHIHSIFKNQTHILLMNQQVQMRLRRKILRKALQ